jgi:hypothetical protein
MQLALFTDEPKNTTKLEEIVLLCRTQITAYKYQALHILAQTSETNPAFSACLRLATRWAELAFLLGRSTKRYSQRTAESWAKEARPNFDYLNPICGTLRFTLPEVLLDYDRRSTGLIRGLKRGLLTTVPGAQRILVQIYEESNKIPNLYEQYFDGLSVTTG